VRYIRLVDTLTLNALGEPSRLRIVELLRERPCSVGEISERLLLRQPQVSKHLRVLTHAGIVGVKPVAQRRVYQLQPERFVEMEAWLGTFRPTWEDRLDTLEESLRGLRASQPKGEKGRSPSEGTPDR